MENKYHNSLSWDSLSRLIIIGFAVLQVVRWRILPQFMDIYYHLSTAWGFIQAGGWSGWDFWQYAPVGRVHIYPPLFHIILALFMKMGVDTVILAKLFECIIPVLFLVVIWYFTRKNYRESMAFFAVIACAGSLSFYLNLINHIPATLAMIFGILSLDQLFQKRSLRAGILLALAFYTHIGISWFFILAVILYGLFDREHKRTVSGVVVYALLLSLPVIIKQLAGLGAVSRLGLNLNEKNLCRFKMVEYILAVPGFILALKSAGKYRLFPALFLASLVFLVYPYRFFSAEGYLPVVFLSACGLESFYNKCLGGIPRLRYGVFFLAAFIFFASPAIIMDRPAGAGSRTYRFSLFESAFPGMALPKYDENVLAGSIWFPEEYLSASRFIKENSRKDDIVYSSINLLGVAFSGITGRATANALLPEIDASEKFDPLSVSKILVIARDEAPEQVRDIETGYRLVRIGQSKLFTFYDNPECSAKVKVRPAAIPFWLIGIAFGVFMYLFLRAK